MNTDEAYFFYFRSEYLQERIRQYEAGRISSDSLLETLHATEAWCIKNADQADEIEQVGINELMDEMNVIMGNFDRH